MISHEIRRLQYEQLFTVLLHMPPPIVDQLTIEQFERHCEYADALNTQS